MKALIGARIFTGDEWLEQHALLLDGDTIAAVIPECELDPLMKVEQLEGGMLVPGFIDGQVNGGGGVMFNDAPNADTLQIMVNGHRRFGTVAMMPTLITDSPEQSQAAIDAVEQAIESGIKEVLGVHLEGPHLSPSRRGAHNADFLRPLGDADIAAVTAPGCGIRLITLSPERTEPGQIRHLTTQGVRVAIGHSAVSYEQAAAAYAEGASGATHLFNAMSPFTSREPGVVGAAILDQNSWCGVIVDGHHVHPASLQLALRAKPAGKMYLVTDAMGNVGAPEPHFYLYGEKIEVVDGVLRNQEGNLAGAAITMIDAVQNCVQLLDLTLDEALRMASRYPAEFLGVSDRLGSLRPGYRASLVHLSDSLAVNATWVSGQGEYYR